MNANFVAGYFNNFTLLQTWHEICFESDFRPPDLLLIYQMLNGTAVSLKICFKEINPRVRKSVWFIELI